ncbi:hypothetical protein BMG00_13090 [Thioclava marina]|uniref:Uncharacterized protein n=1 Tax=Thioclava marina TaxID=1915077 RepID=A0ABX3ML91_9RHOB|nr:hypothetical protein [Thioclava marina]OOY12001.1 hypothetical protein BMG00_13090 [Thioclava marina]
MTKTVLVLNNPSSISILFTPLRAQVDEIWIERGASEKLDRGISQALRVLNIGHDLPIRNMDTKNLFSAGRKRLGKVVTYRRIAAEIDSICRHTGVTEIVCSTTSAFRLARVPRLHVVDHGAGDYLRTRRQTRAERLKYAWLYSGPALRTFSYYAFLPLSGRVHLPLERTLIHERVSRLEHPFAPGRVSVILLVYPLIPLDEQLHRLHLAMAGTPYEVYLKGHHFDPQQFPKRGKSDGDLPALRKLPESLDVLPAEFLIWGFDAELRLGAFESTALWNIGADVADRVIPLAQRDEILALPGPYGSGLASLESDLGYSPFR